MDRLISVIATMSSEAVVIISWSEQFSTSISLIYGLTNSRTRSVIWMFTDLE